ncbi:unnamed protein product [Mucor circinelloides]|uniref:Glycerophosphocholine acyltransferase 1 n=1 Tax=Mucor circinelloides f. circinelloides (strain 1006PhL) TaxID=1220926 RepID=S2KJB4_MUCC1|nr:hypothetical protein HMPREF1544_00543 [Mucor circinelloides 1006PhL]
MLTEERLEHLSSHESDASTLLSEDSTEYDTDELTTVDSWSSHDFVAKDDYAMIGVLSAALEQVTLQIRDVKNEIKALLSTEWTSMTQGRLRKQKILLEARKAMIQDRLLNQYGTIRTRMHRDANAVRLHDKVSFVVGVGNTCITPVIAARLPVWIPIYYTVQLCYLITLRFFVYKSKQWHYFFFDLCYYVNLLTLLFLWVFPSSTLLYTAAFTLTNGPVLWAIITWRNSLVFHSLDKVTSVFIHIFPALVTYTLRWFTVLHGDPDQALVYRDQHFPAISKMPVMGWWYTLFVSTGFYLAWQIFYVCFVMVAKKDKVESGSRTTSYTTLLNKSPENKNKSFILAITSLFGEKYKLHMFIFWQFWYTLGTSALTYFYYKSFWFHSSCLMTMFAVSVWNGASYYIDVFSKHYLDEVERRLAEFKEKNQQNSKILTKQRSLRRKQQKHLDDKLN